MYHAGKNTVYVSRLAAVVLGSFERRVPGHTRPSPGGWGLALLFERGGAARDPLQEHLADEGDHRARNDEREHDKERGDFPDAFGVGPVVAVQHGGCGACGGREEGQAASDGDEDDGAVRTTRRWSSSRYAPPA